MWSLLIAVLIVTASIDIYFGELLYLPLALLCSCVGWIIGRYLIK